MAAGSGRGGVTCLFCCALFVLAGLDAAAPRTVLAHLLGALVSGFRDGLPLTLEVPAAAALGARSGTALPAAAFF